MGNNYKTKNRSIGGVRKNLSEEILAVFVELVEDLSCMIYLLEKSNKPIPDYKIRSR